MEQHNALPNGYEFEGYRVEGVLGAGNFGITYRARELSIDRRVAIKEFLPGGVAVRAKEGQSVHPVSESQDDVYNWGLTRFRREAETLVKFRHPNIVSVLRFFKANGTAYMVMEYEEGESLAAMLGRRPKPSEPEIWAILLPLLDGLEKVHAAGFLHRDIKPDNIYLHTDGTPVILDFGAARQALAQRRGGLTTVVTPGYAPHEQYYSGGEQGPWTDIYALGGVLYLAVSGEMPLEAPARIERDSLVPAREAGAGRYTENLLRGIDQALAIKPADRPQTVADWRRQLSQGSAGARTPDATVLDIEDGAAAPAAGARTGTVVVGDGPAHPRAPRTAVGRSMAAFGRSMAAFAPRLAEIGRDRRALPWVSAAAVCVLAVIGVVVWLASGDSGADTARQPTDLKAKAAESAALAQAAADSEAAKAAAEEARIRAEAEARFKAYEDIKRKAEKDAQKAVASKKAKKEERTAKRKAEADAKKKAEEDELRRARLRVEELARPKREPRKAFDSNTEFEIANRVDGYDVTVYYAPLQIIPDGEKIVTDCRQAAARIAQRIAAQRGRTILPVKQQNVGVNVRRGVVDVRTRCVGSLKVQYKLD